MSMRKRRESRQEEMFVQTSALPDSPGHPFYTQLNELLAVHGFDLFVRIASRRLPAEACGALVWRFDADAQELVAVQLEALTADGQRLTAWPSSSSTREASGAPPTTQRRWDGRVSRPGCISAC